MGYPDFVVERDNNNLGGDTSDTGVIRGGKDMFFKININTPGQLAQFIGTLSPAPKGCWLHSQEIFCDFVRKNYFPMVLKSLLL